jgi:hypothetical protein
MAQATSGVVKFSTQVRQFGDEFRIRRYCPFQQLQFHTHFAAGQEWKISQQLRSQIGVCIARRWGDRAKSQRAGQDVKRLIDNPS